MVQTLTAERATSSDLRVRPLQEKDLPAADRVMRVAFGTFLGMPNPATFMGDAGFVRTRWRADPSAAFGLELEGECVGSNFATNWGSFGFFGPLTVRPDLWDRGLGQRLIEPVMACFERWGTRHAGLFTFAHSQKHVGLYHKFGFAPQFLTAIMSKPVGVTARGLRWTRFSQLPANERATTLRACREVTDALYEGLDVGSEVRAVADQGLGDTVLLHDDGGITGLAVCHCGPGTEAGSGVCFVKFGAVRPGPRAPSEFRRLIEACEAFAAGESLSRLAAGVNTARHEAYRQMLAFGFRTDIQGVAMQKPNEPGYNRPGVYAIDDWR
jgi:GNAT superfamily N-acetyltransferase